MPPQMPTTGDGNGAVFVVLGGDDGVARPEGEPLVVGAIEAAAVLANGAEEAVELIADEDEVVVVRRSLAYTGVALRKMPRSTWFARAQLNGSTTSLLSGSEVTK